MWSTADCPMKTTRVGTCVAEHAPACGFASVMVSIEKRWSTGIVDVVVMPGGRCRTSCATENVHRSEVPQLQQGGAECGGDDAVVEVEAGVGVPGVGEGADGVRYR